MHFKIQACIIETETMALSYSPSFKFCWYVKTLVALRYRTAETWTWTGADVNRLTHLTIRL
jgi:hypothetical protein